MRRILLLIASINFCAVASTFFVTPMLSSFKVSWNLSIIAAELILAAPLLTAMVALVPMGSFSDKVGKEKVVPAGLLLLFISLLAASQSGSPSQLIAFRLLQGLAIAMIVPGTSAVVGDVFEYSRRGKVLGALRISVNSGLIVGFLIGAFIAVPLGWRTSFLVVAAPLGALFLLSLQFRKSLVTKKPKTKASYDFLRLTRVRAAYSCTLLIYLSRTALFGIIPFFAEFKGAGTSWTAAVLISFAAVMAGVGMLAGHLSDKFGRKRITIVSLLAIVPVTFMMVFATTLSTFFVLVVLSGIGYGMALVPLELIPLDSTMRRGTAMGIWHTMRVSGTAIGPLTAGGIIALFGFSVSFLLLFLIVLIAAVMSMVFLKGA